MLVFSVIFDTITQAGAQAIRVREPGQAGNRAAISDHPVVSGNPGFLKNVPREAYLVSRFTFCE
jgi:hypothetical protein